jgi:hypothetical protein
MRVGDVDGFHEGGPDFNDRLDVWYPPDVTVTDERLQRSLHEFYGDMYRIEGWNVAIFGFGKSHAGRVAAGQRPAHYLVTDDLRLWREGNDLFAALDVAVFGERDARPRSHRVDAFVRCLREDETKRFYVDRPLALAPLPVDEFIRASRWNIGFPLTTENIETRVAEREPLFRSLVEGAVSRFFLVPWMATADAKGELLRSHFAKLAMEAPARPTNLCPILSPADGAEIQRGSAEKRSPAPPPGLSGSSSW